MIKKDTSVKVIGNYRIASYLIKKGYKVVNIKKYRDFICEVTGEICNYRTAFTFLIEDNFLNDLEFAKDKYAEINDEEY